VNRCGSCGIENETVQTHSNHFECRGCWNHRKLDSPAAQHWAQAAKDFLLKVDAYDIMTYFPRALEDVKNGKGEPVDVTWGQMLNAVQAVMLHSERVLKDGPYHVWDKTETPSTSD
jgi:hypothetical protein